MWMAYENFTDLSCQSGNVLVVKNCISMIELNLAVMHGANLRVMPLNIDLKTIKKNREPQRQSLFFIARPESTFLSTSAINSKDIHEYCS